MTIRDQIAKILSSEIDVSDDGEILHIDDAAGVILAAFPALLINSDDHKIIAKALRDGARGDIWYDAERGGPTAVEISTARDAMETAADILHKEEPEDNVELEVWSKWSVMIPATFCDSLDHDTVEALIAMLHKHGAGETIHYADIIAEYHTEYHGDTVVTGAVAFAACKAALTEMFPDLSITQEEPEEDE
jgi:hypothetical protein